MGELKADSARVAAGGALKRGRPIRPAAATGTTDFPLLDAPPWPYEDADPLTDRARRRLSESTHYWRTRKNATRRRKPSRGGAVWVVGLTLVALSSAAFMIWRDFGAWIP
jgi:hypothetical protein